MHNKIYQNSEYFNCPKEFIFKKYCIKAIAILSAKRGYYGETRRLEAFNHNYFVKIDYFRHHQELFKNGLSVVEYLCNNNIDFISNIIRTFDVEFYSIYNSAVLGIFEWIDGGNIEIDNTKISEYKTLCKIYPFTKQGFYIPIMEFSDIMAVLFYEKLERLKKAPQTKVNTAILSLIKQKRDMLSNRTLRLLKFASICKKIQMIFLYTWRCRQKFLCW